MVKMTLSRIVILILIVGAPSVTALSFDVSRHTTTTTTKVTVSPPFPTRRALLLGGTVALLRPSAVVAADDEPTMTTTTTTAFVAAAAEQPTTTTTVVTLHLSVNRSQTTRPLRIELLPGPENNEAVSFFQRVASGTLTGVPCSTDDTIALSNLETCQDYESRNVSYDNSQLWRLVPNRRLDFGRVDSVFAQRVPPTFTTTSSATTTTTTPSSLSSLVRPSTRGAVSIKRDGGAFEFTIAPVDNAALDRENLVVVGRVVGRESVALLEEIHTTTPTRGEVVRLGDVPPLGSKIARACDFTSPDRTCAQYKPLKRIVVVASTVTTEEVSTSE